MAQAGGFALRCLPAPTDSRARLGVQAAVIVPARVVASAAARNALKRRITSVLGELLRSCPQGTRCIITVRSSDIPRSVALRSALTLLFRDAGLTL
jgi:RNase P protein component